MQKVGSQQRPGAQGPGSGQCCAGQTVRTEKRKRRVRSVRRSLQPVCTMLHLIPVSQPGLGMETGRPSQLLLPAITRLTSLLSGKWCFD